MSTAVAQQVVVQEKTVINTQQTLREIEQSVETISGGTLTATIDQSAGTVVVTDTSVEAVDVKEYAFAPDIDEAKQVDTKGQENLSVTEEGFYEVTTSTGLQVPLRLAPKDVQGVSKLIGGGEVTLGSKGDVSISLPAQALQGKMTVGMFDSAVVSAPANLSAGVHIPRTSNIGCLKRPENCFLGHW